MILWKYATLQRYVLDEYYLLITDERSTFDISNGSLQANIDLAVHVSKKIVAGNPQDVHGTKSLHIWRGSDDIIRIIFYSYNACASPFL